MFKAQIHTDNKLKELLDLLWIFLLMLTVYHFNAAFCLILCILMAAQLMPWEKACRMADSICEEKIFKRLFNELGKPIRDFAYFKSRSLSTAEDVMQETFVRLWKNCGKVNVDKAKAYLYRVAGNLIIDMGRKQTVAAQYLNVVEVETYDNNTPHNVLEENELKSKINAALNGLSDKRRTVFLMSRVDNLTYKEIAERLEISVKAVEKRMHAALSELRSKVYTDNL